MYGKPIHFSARQVSCSQVDGPFYRNLFSSPVYYDGNTFKDLILDLSWSHLFVGTKQA